MTATQNGQMQSFVLSVTVYLVGRVTVKSISLGSQRFSRVPLYLLLSPAWYLVS